MPVINVNLRHRASTGFFHHFGAFFKVFDLYGLFSCANQAYLANGRSNHYNFLTTCAIACPATRNLFSICKISFKHHHDYCFFTLPAYTRQIFSPGISIVGRKNRQKLSTPPIAISYPQRCRELRSLAFLRVREILGGRKAGKGGLGTIESNRTIGDMVLDRLQENLARLEKDLDVLEKNDFEIFSPGSAGDRLRRWERKSLSHLSVFFSLLFGVFSQTFKVSSCRA